MYKCSPHGTLLLYIMLNTGLIAGVVVACIVVVVVAIVIVVAIIMFVVFKKRSQDRLLKGKKVCVHVYVCVVVVWLLS